MSDKTTGLDPKIIEAAQPAPDTADKKDAIRAAHNLWINAKLFHPSGKLRHLEWDKELQIVLNALLSKPAAAAAPEGVRLIPMEPLKKFSAPSADKTAEAMKCPVCEAPLSQDGSCLGYQWADLGSCANKVTPYKEDKS